MIILTSRLMLRPFELSDLNEFYEVTRSEEIRKYVAYAYAEDKRELLANIKDYQNRDFIHEFYFVIEELITTNIIGAIIATKKEGNDLEVSYLLGEKYRQKGYMTEAMESFIKNIAIGLGYNLVFIISETNEASLKTAKKIGAVFTYASKYGKVFRYDV